MQLSLFLLLAGLLVAEAAPLGQYVICYFGSWARYRPGDGKFTPQDIDPNVCTHIMYSFTGLGWDNKMSTLDAWSAIDLGDYKAIAGLKQQNPDLKTMVAIGGWNEGSSKYSAMAGNAAARATFVQSVVDFLKKYNFDGLDFDWEYPAHRGGSPDDFANFPLLLEELRAAFDKEGAGWLLSAAVSANPKTVDTAYDVPRLARTLDWIGLMTYDYCGAWDLSAGTGHQARLYGGGGGVNTDISVNYWMKQGAPADKLVMGLAAYGRTWTLQNPNNNGLGAPVSGAGGAGPFTRESGSLGYLEICMSLKEGGWTVVFDESVAGPYASNGNFWVGYDDVQSITIKSEYIKAHGLAGGMFWSIEQDDAKNICGEGKFPLISAAKNTLAGAMPITTAKPATTTANPATTPEKPVTTPGKPDTTPKPSTPTPKPTTKPSTTAQPPEAEECTVEGWFANIGDCRGFYYCQRKFLEEGFYKHQHQCHPDTVYHATLIACVWPWQSERPECKSKVKYRTNGFSSAHREQSSLSRNKLNQFFHRFHNVPKYVK